MNGTPEPLLVAELPPARCRCCHRPIPTGKAYDGYGETCARQRGLLPPRIPRPATDRQDGPDLFDLLTSHNAEANNTQPGDHEV
jgi:hypothetical protein